MRLISSNAVHRSPLPVERQIWYLASTLASILALQAHALLSMYLWQPGKSSPASNPFLLWARHRLPHKRPSRKVPHALRPRAAHVGPHRRWRSRVLGLQIALRIQHAAAQRRDQNQLDWRRTFLICFRPKHALNQRSFFGTQTPFPLAVCHLCLLWGPGLLSHTTHRTVVAHRAQFGRVGGSRWGWVL